MQPRLSAICDGNRHSRQTLGQVFDVEILGTAGGQIPITPGPGITDADLQVSEMMMQMWSQFAKTGDPNVEGLIQWPVYDILTDQYLYVRDGLQVKTGFSEVAQTP